MDKRSHKERHESGLKTRREVFLQVAIYCGVPAGVEAFRSAKEVFKERGV